MKKDKDKARMQAEKAFKEPVFEEKVPGEESPLVGRSNRGHDNEEREVYEGMGQKEEVAEMRRQLRWANMQDEEPWIIRVRQKGKKLVRKLKGLIIPSIRAVINRSES